MSAEADFHEMSGIDGVHPAFTQIHPQDDIILLSQDNIRFHIASTTLKRTSGWFRVALTLPQTPESTSEPLPMSEPSEVVASLLSIINGTALPPLDDLAHLDAVLAAAEKYDMPLPVALIRALLPTFIPASPIRAYGIACRMDWAPERAQAAAASCALNILARENVREVARLEPPHLERLLALHEARRDALAAALESHIMFVANVKGKRCRGADPDVGCGELVDHTAWGAFKFACMREPWRLVLLNGTAGGHPPAAEVPMLKDLLEDKCPKCGKAYYSVLDTVRNLALIVKELPSTIDLEVRSDLY